jgi:hypothetical protein
MSNQAAEASAGIEKLCRISMSISISASSYFC